MRHPSVATPLFVADSGPRLLSLTSSRRRPVTGPGATQHTLSRLLASTERKGVPRKLEVGLKTKLEVKKPRRLFTLELFSTPAFRLHTCIYPIGTCGLPGVQGCTAGA